MSCGSGCCLERKTVFGCSKMCAVHRSPPTQASAQIHCSCVHTHSPHAACCTSSGYGHHFHHSPSLYQLGCRHCSPHHTHCHVHHHPLVASPLLYSRQTPSSPVAIVHPHHCSQHIEPSLLCRSTSQNELEPPPTNGFAPNKQMSSSLVRRPTSSEWVDAPHVQRSVSNPRLEQSPLSRPHLHHNRLHPHYREQLFAAERSQSNSKLSLEFSPASTQGDSPPSSNSFVLGTALEHSQDSLVSKNPTHDSLVSKNPTQDSLVSKNSTQDSLVSKNPTQDAQAVHDETIKYDSQAEVTIPPAVTMETNSLPIAIETDVSEPVVIVEVTAPPTEAVVATSITSSTGGGLPVQTPVLKPSPTAPTGGVARKPKSPILLYKWSFKVMTSDIVVLLGYKSLETDELKWRSGPVIDRLSASLLVTKSGQLYHLMGHLNIEDVAKESPQLRNQVLRKFRKGFPSQWKTLLWESKPPDKPKPKRAPSLPDIAKVKKEKEEGGVTSAEKSQVKAEVRTPVMLENAKTPTSNFISSLKRSSRGRTIKPPMLTFSTNMQSCSDLYSYDWHGNFTGITSVIDLTVSDDPLPPKRHRSIKKEPVSDDPLPPKRHIRVKKEPAEDLTSVPSHSVVNTTSTAGSAVAPPISRTQMSKKRNKESSREILALPSPALERKRRQWESERLHHEDKELEVFGHVKSESTQEVKGRSSKTKSEKKSKAVAEKDLDAERDHNGGDVVEHVRQRGRSDNGQVVDSTMKDDDSEDERNDSKSHLRGRSGQPGRGRSVQPGRRRSRQPGRRRSGQSGRRKLKGHSTDATTSEGSDMESTRRSRLPKTHPAPDGKKVDKLKVLETSVLDWSHSIGPSSQAGREKEECTRMMQTSKDGGSSELPNDEGEVMEMKFSDKDLRNLRQVVHGVSALTANFWEVVAMKLGTGHTAQQCSTAYHNQRVTNKSQKPNCHTDCAMSRKQPVSVAPLKSAKKAMGKHASARVASESSRSSNDGTESESNSNKCRQRERRRKVRRHVTDATTSEDSDMDFIPGNRQAKLRPPQKKKTDKRKVFGTISLDMSHSMRRSSQSGRGKDARTMTHTEQTHTEQTLQEGDGGKSLGGEAEAMREKETSTNKIQTSSTDLDADNELCGYGQQLKDDNLRLHDLRQVVLSVPVLTNNFWETVARKLGPGYSAQLCSEVYHKQIGNMKPPSTKPTRKEKVQPLETSITAKSGTLKRKRQLRDALEHLDSGYHDDIFDSTPLKKIKKSVKIPESCDNPLEETDKLAHPMHTPSVVHVRLGAPTTQTPSLCDYLTTPDLKSNLKRDAADHVIYNARKTQKGVKKNVTFQETITKSLICEQKLRNIRTGELTTLRMFEDSDDSCSEDSNPFEDDILTML